MPQTVLAIQGIYYVVFGFWPILHMKSFLSVTGKKGKYDNLDSGAQGDHWLVITVSLLLIAVGLTLVASAIASELQAPTYILSGLVAGSLALVDVRYVSRGIIARIYLLDAAVELALLFLILVTPLFT